MSGDGRGGDGTGNGRGGNGTRGPGNGRGGEAGGDGPSGGDDAGGPGHGSSDDGHGSGDDSTDGTDDEGRPAGTDDAWRVLESRTEYETGWYAGGYDLVEQPDGSTKRYYWAELAPAVVAVAVADAGVAADERSVVFVEQYRPAVRETHLELPAGLVEDGESFPTAGARELREETGFEPAGTSLLAEYWVATGVLRHRRGIVFAEGLTPGERDHDDNEFLSVRPVPAGEALARAREPPANDATLEGLLLAREDGLL